MLSFAPLGLSQDAVLGSHLSPTEDTHCLSAFKGGESLVTVVIFIIQDADYVRIPPCFSFHLCILFNFSISCIFKRCVCTPCPAKKTHFLVIYLCNTTLFNYTFTYCVSKKKSKKPNKMPSTTRRKEEHVQISLFIY